MKSIQNNEAQPNTMSRQKSTGTLGMAMNFDNNMSKKSMKNLNQRLINK